MWHAKTRECGARLTYALRKLLRSRNTDAFSPDWHMRCAQSRGEARSAALHVESEPPFVLKIAAPCSGAAGGCTAALLGVRLDRVVFERRHARLRIVLHRHFERG